MRIPYPRTVLTRSAKGSIQDPDDAELVVPSIINSLAVVGTPLDPSALLPSTTTVEQSFFGGANAVQLGATGTAINTQRFSKGLWHVRGQFTISWAGTVGNNAVTLFLTDTNGVTAVDIVFRAWLVATPSQLSFPLDLWMMLADDGCRFTTSVPGGAVGDALAQSINFLANKIW